MPQASSTESPSNSPMDSPVRCRGVRGAIAIDNPADHTQVESAVRKLLSSVLSQNRAFPDDLAAIIFTLPDDLSAVNPAAAARAAGFDQVPLLAVREHGAVRRVDHCLRVLVLVNTSIPQAQIRHPYLGEASILRPDLVARDATVR